MNKTTQKYLTAIIISIGSLFSTGYAVENTGSLGVVNFVTCISNSKIGKQEQEAFESLRKQMTSLVQETEKQINDLSAKFNDPEFLDALSPGAEEELKTKFHALNEDLNRYQNQYYQVLQQSNMKLMQTLTNSINVASEKVAKDKKLSLVVNKDSCFFAAATLDVTDQIIEEMDRSFDKDAKKAADAQQAETKGDAK